MKCSKPVILSNLTVGCGQCLSCRINKRRQWTGKLLAESSRHPPGTSFFVTLTYTDDKLPRTPDGTPNLSPEDACLFLKRVRRSLGSTSRDFRFFLVGEYGDRTQRPHYHLAAFGLIPPITASRRSTSRSSGGSSTDSAARSRVQAPATLDSWLLERWGKGHVMVAPMTPERASYVAGYCVKKLTKPGDVRLGQRHPEFTRMSRRPALGDSFIDALGDWLTKKAGAQYIIQAGDVPTAFRQYGKTYPLSPRHQRKLRQLAGLPEKRSEVKMFDPLRWDPPELPSAEELNERKQREIQYARTKKVRATARHV